MRAYLAASYGRREELAGYAEQLREHGVDVQARWLSGEHEHDMEADPEKADQFASEDLQDIDACGMFVSFSDEAYVRGGKHTELGFALALQDVDRYMGRGPRRVIVVGRREHIFHYLKEVEVYPTWEDFLATFKETAYA